MLRQSMLAEKERLRKIEESEEEQLRKVLEMSSLDASEHAMIQKLEEKVA